MASKVFGVFLDELVSVPENAREAAAYLDKILIHSCLASQHFERPVRHERTHANSVSDSPGCLAQLPALLFTECWCIEAGEEKLGLQTLGQMREVCFITTSELVRK